MAGPVEVGATLEVVVVPVLQCQPIISSLRSDGSESGAKVLPTAPKTVERGNKEVRFHGQVLPEHFLVSAMAEPAISAAERRAEANFILTVVRGG